MQYLDARFKVVPGILNMSGTTTTTSSTTAAEIKGSRINLAPGFAGDGVGIRYKIAGTKSAANGTLAVKLYVDGTAVLTLTSATTSSNVDWMADMTLFFVNEASQRACGFMMNLGLVPRVDYATGTVNCTSGVPVYLTATCSNGSDTVTVDMVDIRGWVFEPTATA